MKSRSAVNDPKLEVLIVDDELDILLALTAMLQELRVMKISVAVDGSDALDALSITQFHMLFLDLDLPIVSGEEVLANMTARANVMRPERVVAMSAGWRSAELDKYLALNRVDAWLQKPFDYADLQGIISAAPAHKVQR